MRLEIIAALALGFAVLGGAALADPPTETPASDAKSADTAAAMLAYYPPAARAAGVEGLVVMSCGRYNHGAPGNCTLVSENPADQGFAAAAQSLIEHATQNPKLPDQANKPAVQVTFQFKLNPPAVTPDVLKTPHGKPRWAGLPDANDLVRVYPSDAARHGLDGRAVLTCTVTDEGLLANCGVTATPSGQGFEEAALKLAKRFRMSPRTIDGESVGGSHVTVPVFFKVAR